MKKGSTFKERKKREFAVPGYDVQNSFKILCPFLFERRTSNASLRLPRTSNLERSYGRRGWSVSA